MIARDGQIAGLNRERELGGSSEFFRSFVAPKASVHSDPLTRCIRDVRAKDIDRATAVADKAELYYIAHPTSPSAVRRPKLSVRSGTWIALLGRSVQDGIRGFGASVEGALRAFDGQYLKALRAPDAQLIAPLRAPVEASFHRAA
jgi:hypothetical protein